MTLLEILISAGLLAVMFATTTEITTRLVEIQAESEQVQITNQMQAATLQKIFQDVSQAFQVEKALQGTQASYHTGMKGEASYLEFSTRSGQHVLQDGKDSAASWVRYELEACATQGPNCLTRRQTPHLATQHPDQVMSYPMLSHIKEMKIEYYDSNKRHWVGSWNSESISTLGVLPQMVRFTFDLVSPGNETKIDAPTQRLQTVVPIQLFSYKLAF